VGTRWPSRRRDYPGGGTGHRAHRACAKAFPEAGSRPRADGAARPPAAE
jgi:hypothetical protein